MNEKDMINSTTEKRKYQRFAKKIPIEFVLAELQQSLMPGIDVQKGYTVNVSEGGMCIETPELSESTIKYLNQQHMLLNVNVFVPLSQQPIRLVGSVSWFEKISESSGTRYVIGIKFRSIKPQDLKVLFRQTNRFWYLVLAIVALTIVFVLSLLYHFVLSKS